MFADLYYIDLMRHRIAVNLLQFQLHINSILFSVCGDPDEFFGLPASWIKAKKPIKKPLPASLKRLTNLPTRLIGGIAEYECEDGFLHYDAEVSSK